MNKLRSFLLIISFCFTLISCHQNNNNSLDAMAKFNNPETIQSALPGGQSSEVERHVNAPLPPHKDGYFSVTIFNETNNVFNDSKFYIQFMAFLTNTPRNLGIVTLKLTGEKTAEGYPIGTLSVPKQTDFNKPVSAITLDQLKNGTFYLPDHQLNKEDVNGKIYAGRIYLSMGNPLQDLKIVDQDTFAQPSVDSAAVSKDKNTPYEWYEFTYDPSMNKDGSMKAQFNSNTTQVDSFGIPLWFRASDIKGKFTPISGFTIRDTAYSPVYLNSRNDIFKRYASFTKGTPFSIENLGQGLAFDGSYARIITSYHNLSKFPSNYFDGYINEIWDYYKVNKLKFCTRGDAFDHEQGDCYVGFVNNENMLQLTHYTMPGNIESDDCTSKNPCMLKNPVTNPPKGMTTLQCILSENCFAYESTTRTWQAAFNVQIMSAINRHVATEEFKDGSGFARWHDSSIFYLRFPMNYYANFWHTIAVGHMAYGMPYDDAGDQSSDSGLQNKLENITLGIGW